MRIVWVKSDYVDPPDTGGKIRTYNLLKQLQQKCEVTYVSLRDLSGVRDQPSSKPWASNIVTFDHREERKQGARFVAKTLARMLSTSPYIVQKYTSQEIHEYLQRTCGGPNGHTGDAADDIVLICDFLEMAGNIAWSSPVPKILFQHNVESVIWKRYYENEQNPFKKAYLRFEHARLKRFERAACDRFDLVLTVSEEDKQTLRRDLGVQTPLEVIDTGVDVDYFATVRDGASTPGRLLFLGSLDWRPNIDGLHWFVRNSYPRIKALHPEVTLDVVGRRPVASVREMEKADPSIRIYADVPDVRPYLATADVFVVPLRIGSGTRLKIFEAMAARRPVVSTTVGSEGLPLNDGEHVVLADSPDDFANQVCSLLDHPARKDALSAAGWSFVTENYSWQSVAEKLYDVCLHTCRAHTATRRNPLSV